MNSMQEQFDDKADHRDINKLQKTKADKEDIPKMRSLIECVNERLKQVAILQKEMAFNLQTHQFHAGHFNQNTKQGYTFKMEQMMQYADNVSNWINNSSLEEQPLIQSVKKKRVQTAIARPRSKSIAFPNKAQGQQEVLKGGLPETPVSIKKENPFGRG